MRGIAQIIGLKVAETCKVLLGYDKEVAEWVRQRLAMDSGFGECAAIGVVLTGKLIAGVVYHNYRHPNIEVSIASISPRWATKTTLKLLFDYPFNQLNCKRITGLVDSENQPVRAFDERLGFIHEGTLREAHPNGDAEIYGMLKHECRWIK